jgi:ubiquinone/menaquinone biosynthesis C-methylase UbiE
MMGTPRVDYANLASIYDNGRALSKGKEAMWLSLLEQHLGLDANSSFLDIGCGTGRFAVPLARQVKCTVVGLDPSPSMLAEAQRKCQSEVVWLLARAEAIPVRDAAFDVCFVSQVIHHFLDRHRAFAEMYRVLQQGGRLGIRYSSHAQLRTILDYRFFPSALSIDLDRLPDIPVVIDLMRTVGFRVVEEHVIYQQLFETADNYLEMVRNKYSSVLSLISEKDYQGGLREATAYLKSHELEASDKYAEITLLSGIK